MPDAGRIFCVAFPFVATAAALVVLLVAMLGGKHVPQLYMFQVNLTGLSVDPQGVAGLLDSLTNGVNVSDVQNTLENLPNDVQDQIQSLTGSSVDSFVTEPPLSARDLIGDILSGGSNISAADLGLQNIYNVNLWGVCSGASESNTTCTDPKWDWASAMLNTTWLENVGSAMGANITLPEEVSAGIKTFNTCIKWLQIVFVIALALLGVDLAVGLFTSCSRLVSCVAWVVAGAATAVTIAAAAFATAVVATSVGVIKASADIYGAEASLNTTFLAVIWIAVALAMTASLFWCISACCCANRRKATAAPFAEKHYSSSSYAPLSGNVAGPAYAQQGQNQHHQSSSGAYEPYSHRV